MAQTLGRQVGQLDHSDHLVEHSCFNTFIFIKNYTKESTPLSDLRI